MRLMFAPLLLLSLLTACAAPDESALLDGDDGEQDLTGFAMTEAGKQVFAKGLRQAFATRLTSAVFPLYDERDIKIHQDLGPLGRIEINKRMKTTGETRANDPLQNAQVTVEDMRRTAEDMSLWKFEAVAHGPGIGWVKTHIESLGHVIDTPYTSKFVIKFFGDLRYVPVRDEENERIVLDIQAKFTDLQGHIEDLHFEHGLPTIPGVADIIQGEANGIIEQSRQSLLDQANGSLAEAAANGELHTNFEEFFALFPNEGGQ